MAGTLKPGQVNDVYGMRFVMCSCALAARRWIQTDVSYAFHIQSYVCCYLQNRHTKIVVKKRLNN